MLSAVATPAFSQPCPRPSGATQHQYGTRIRSNSIIKPSVRLRQSPDHPPRRINPVPITKAKSSTPSAKEPATPEMPAFPPPNVLLHSEDMNSKVFMAIGRAFMSVNNNAMTIKDLADMTMDHGLQCQNASAAGQAITTYIRNHLQRCEVQRDQPLLLRHIMSGTNSDDDLVNALHSRAGGAHCVLGPNDKRITNFRRGTVVWYLSRAAGGPCPFTRIGIRLCEYGENGRIGTAVHPGKERKRERDRQRRAEQSGQKRKRLPRACAQNGSDSESSADETPAPKVKLTLRLKPTLAITSSSRQPSPTEVIDLSNDPESDDASMSIDSPQDEPEQPLFPPYPKRTMPSLCFDKDNSHQVFNSSLAHGSLPALGFYRAPADPFGTSWATPPPDSDDEDSMFDLLGSTRPSTARSRRGSSAFSDDGHGLDDEMQWEPTPPPAQFDDEVRVKEEPRDVNGFLTAWDDFESIVMQAAAGQTDPEVSKLKLEELDTWVWPELNEAQVTDDETFIVKQEDEDASLYHEHASLSPSASPISPYSYLSAPQTPQDSPMDSYMDYRRHSEPLWQDAQILGPDSVDLHDLDNDVWRREPLTATRKSCSNSMTFKPLYESRLAVPFDPQSPSADSPSPDEPRTHIAAESSPASTYEDAASPSSELSESSAESLSLSSRLDSPLSGVEAGSECDASDDEEIPVILHTCEPCVPAICAVEMEGILVYQTVLGPSCILRRIDTDFVNISPILQFFGLPHPDTSATSTTVVSRGNSLVCGVWISLASAQELFHDQPLVKTFLSDELFMRFPPALHDLHHSHSHSRSLNQFGSNFQSTTDAKRDSASRLELPPREFRTPWERGMVPHWDVEDHLLSVHPPFALGSAALSTAFPASEDLAVPETPLSPTEEEMFHTLCSVADWDPPSHCAAPPTPCTQEADTPPPMEEEEEEEEQQPEEHPEPELQQPEHHVRSVQRHEPPERPLRRSKRGANATPAPVIERPRTRSTAKNAKHRS